MKRTALDIFFSKLGMHEQWVMQHDFEQAKEMEKYQIIDAFEEGISDEASQQNTTPQQYYHKKYGGKDAE